MSDELLRLNQRILKQFFFVQITAAILVIIRELLGVEDSWNSIHIGISGLVIWGLILFKKQNHAKILGFLRVGVAIFVVVFSLWLGYLAYNTIILNNEYSFTLISMTKSMTLVQKLREWVTALEFCFYPTALAWILLYNTDKALDFVKKSRKDLAENPE